MGNKNELNIVQILGRAGTRDLHLVYEVKPLDVIAKWAAVYYMEFTVSTSIVSASLLSWRCMTVITLAPPRIAEDQLPASRHLP